MANADSTQSPDVPSPLIPPKRTEVKVLKVESVKAGVEPKSGPAEETFADPMKRLQLEKPERETLSRLLDDVLGDIEQQRRDLDCDGNWDLWEDNYFGVLADPGPGQQNRVHIPLTQEVIDTVVSVMHRSLFTSSPVFQISPREAMDVETAKKKEQHLDYAFQVEMKGPERLESVIFETPLLGTGVVHLPWLLETDRIRDEEIYDGLNLKDMERFDARYPDPPPEMAEVVKRLKQHQKVRFGVEYTEAIHDAPDLTPVPLRDWIVRPLAKPHLLHRELFLGHRFTLRWDDLVRLEEEGYYDEIDSVKYTTNERGEPVETPDYKDEEYQIVTGVLRWRREGETRERRYLADFHRKSRTILRLLRYPYWHNRVNYIPFYIQKSTRYVYGISVSQKVEGSQWEANASHSLLLDLLSYSVPLFAARSGTEQMFNPLRDGIYAGKTFYFPNPSQDVRELQVSTPSSANFLIGLEDRATRHAELSSGATQNLSGLESARDPNAPATKTIHQTNQALIRIGKYLAVFAPSMTELAFQIEELYYQFSPKGRVFRVVGPKGVPAFPTISRQELRLRADYFPHISTAALNPDKNRDDTIQAMALLLKEPGIQGVDRKRWMVLEMVLDVLGSDWSKRKYDVLPSPDEMALFEEEESLALEVRRKKVAVVSQQLAGGADVGTGPAGTLGGGQGAPTPVGNGVPAGGVSGTTVPAGGRLALLGG